MYPSPLQRPFDAHWGQLEYTNLSTESHGHTPPFAKRVARYTARSSKLRLECGRYWRCHSCYGSCRGVSAVLVELLLYFWCTMLRRMGMAVCKGTQTAMDNPPRTWLVPHYLCWLELITRISASDTGGRAQPGPVGAITRDPHRHYLSLPHVEYQMVGPHSGGLHD